MSWPVVKLHEICRPRQWKTIPASKLKPEGYPVYGANGKIGFYSEYTHQEPTLTITCRGATCGNVHISDPFSYINGNAMALDNLDSNLADIKYLYYFFLSRGFDDVISGSAQPQITGQGLTKVTVPLPPLEEQKRISAILDKADVIRHKRQQAIQLADDFLRSVFLDMFGDPVTNSKGWGKNQLQEVCHKVVDCPHSTPKWTENGVIGLRTSNLTKGGWNWNDKRFVSEATYSDRTKRAELKENDIILSREGTVGIAALVPPNTKMCMGQRLVQLRANTDLICPEFLLFFLLYELEPERISRVMAGSTSKHLNVKDLKSLEVFIPPLDQQEKFASIFRHKKLVEARFGNSTFQSDLNFKSLSQKAFTGEL